MTLHEALREKDGEPVTSTDDSGEVDEPTTDVEADTDFAVDDAADDAVRPRLGGRELAFQVGALLLATVVLASGLFAWWHAERDAEPADLGDTRDAALIAARNQIEIMNTLDYRKVDEGVGAWIDTSTGVLHDQLVAMSPEERQLLADQKKVSVAKVVDAAVLDVTATTATVIASVEVTIQDDAVPDSEPTVKRNRFSAQMAKVDGTWLLEDIAQVAVNLS